MQNLFEGLYLHDILLIVLGTLMFLVMLIGFMAQIIRKQPITKFYILGFLIPALMIAYPSIQRINFSKEVIELEKITREIEQNPDDSIAYKKLETQLKTIEKKPISRPETLAKVSKGNFQVGNTEKAGMLADSALQKAPDNMEAREIKAYIDIDKASQKVKKDPNNQEAKEQVAKGIKLLEELPGENPLREKIKAEAREVVENPKRVKPLQPKEDSE